MKNSNRRTAIILLAYAHRYLYPLLVLFIPFLIRGDALLLYMGIGFLLLAAYDLIGYKCRWKHIFCSFQNAYYKKMTPNKMNWNSVKKSDAYGMPAIFGILGIAMILCHFYV